MSEQIRTTVLYRPVGERELELIRGSGSREFPPRLPEQPIFYPVLNEEYATQIARDWNTRDGGVGYVLRFQIETEYLNRFPIQTAGAHAPGILDSCGGIDRIQSAHRRDD